MQCPYTSQFTLMCTYSTSIRRIPLSIKFILPSSRSFWWCWVTHQSQVRKEKCIALDTSTLFHSLFWHPYTVGSQLSKLRLTVSNAWMSPCFQQQWEKDVASIWVLLQEKAKLLYEWLFPDATMPLLAGTGFRSWFAMSELAERSHEHCSTLFYSVANYEVWQITRRGK